MKRRAWVFAATLSAIGFAAGDASAQALGFAIDRFEPSERGSEWFTEESLDWGGHVRGAAGVVVEGAYRPLALYNPDGSLRASVIRDQVVLHPGGSLTLWHRLQLALSLPVVIFADGQAGSVDGVALAPPATASVGDLRIGAILRLYRSPGDTFIAAAGLHLFVPTGSRADFTSDASVRVEPSFLIAGGFRQVFYYAAQLAFELRGLQDRVADASLGSELTFGAAAGFRFLHHRLNIGPEFFGSTVVVGAAPFSGGVTPAEAMLGAHFTAGAWRFGGGIGLGLTSALGEPLARWSASVEWVGQ